MIRGMHYMCWFREDWNYHPSLPMKRLQQVQDIVDVNGNLLLWSCMGSGAIGIQYLDKEANESIPPRLRFYGHLNDREFCEECGKRGITAFAVVWMAQLWEFPAEFDEDESELLALNKLRGVGKKGWLGMRELSTDRYPKIFPSIREYFPEGLIDSDGNPVKDFLEEFRAVTLDGNPILSTWLMVPDHEHHCYTPCGNKRTYLQYIKKEIELMVDAGAQGIHIDEFDVQLHALFNGGCFCKDCMKGFRAYLKENPSEATAGLDLDHFDYREFLKQKGYTDNDLLGTQADRRFSIPLFKQFVQFNVQRIDQNVAEISSYAREYSLKQRGQAVLVTANLFNCLPHTASIRKYCDLVIGEKSNIKLRQDGFYRFGHAFLQGKQGCFIEDPNEHILQIIEDIDNGKNDSYILFMMEPLAQGFNVAIPYGAWLMNFKKDSFYPNMQVERKMGDWLKRHDFLFTNHPVAETALLYDQRSALDTELFLSGHEDKEKEGGFHTFHDLCQMLCNEHILFNVLYICDDQQLTRERVSSYKNLIIPDAYCLRDDEIVVIREWADHGGRVATLGKVDPRLADLRFTYRKFAEFKKWILEVGQVLKAEDIRDVGIGLQKRTGGYVLHLVNYGLNSVSRVIETIPRMEFKLDWRPSQVQVYSFPETAAEASIAGDSLVVRNIGIYTVIDLQ